MSPRILMTDPAHFDVSYQINPWMRPGEWGLDAEGHKRSARRSWDGLALALKLAGASVEVIPGERGWPDMVFPANAAVVLDGKALLARFRCAERQGEEPAFRAALRRLGLEVVRLPEGTVHEGAGDGIWDERRRLFWTGWGQRSDRGAAQVIEEVFGRETVALELASPRFYHLDTCFRPLSGGEVLYYPPAFTERALAKIRDRIVPELRLEADDEDAAAFCVNAVNLGRTIVMAEAPQRLAARLAERGYDVREVDLAPFILSGGAAFCMTLRLDHLSTAPALPPTLEGASS
jgi:N-dimethylarginine dimethylaminohydrolase